MSYFFSGGESCDELDEYAASNVTPAVDVVSGNSLPIRKRAKWRWLNNRSSVASRWTWLTAQISDLEYRIRQQVRTGISFQTSLGSEVSVKVKVE